jgi:hypothetical protein
MSVQQRGFSNNIVEVEPNRSIRSNLVCRGQGYGVTASTGLIAAGLAANSTLFAMRLDPGAGARLAFIESVLMQYTCITAFTAPVTAGRRLELVRGTSIGEATAGAPIAIAPPKSTSYQNSEFNDLQGGDIRIATTGALTANVYTYEANGFRAMSLAHVGAAGNFLEQTFEFSAGKSEPICLQPGQVLAVRNPVAMDAVGVWTLTIGIDWHEAAALA